jgi:hypothetical protein
LRAPAVPEHEDPKYIARSLVNTEAYLKQIQKDDDFFYNLKLETPQEREARMKRFARFCILDQFMSIAASTAHQTTWCSIQRLCVASGKDHHP